METIQASFDHLMRENLSILEKKLNSVAEQPVRLSMSSDATTLVKPNALSNSRYVSKPASLVNFTGVKFELHLSVKIDSQSPFRLSSIGFLNLVKR